MGRLPDRVWRLAVAALCVLHTPPVRAADVYRSERDEINVRLDTTMSLGVSLRTEDRDRGLIWIGHGGKNTNAAAINSDDGDLNYDQWDVYSTLTKATSELEATWRNYSAFVRATAFWDPIANCSDTGTGAPNQPGFDAPKCTQRTPLDAAARHRPNQYEGGVVGAQFQLLDAYLEGDWKPFGPALDVRLGNQLISWGTSFYYQGVNQINPVDVSKLRVPGSEVKEALLPSPMVRVQTELFQDVGLDAYYQFYWNRTHLDPTGSYFSSSDLLGRGASLPTNGDGNLQGFYLPNVLGDIFGPADPGGTGLTPEQLIFAAGIARVRGIPRLSDDEPRDQGQAGASLRYLHETTQTELGLYYVHFHSKTPVLGFEARGIPPLGVPNTPTNAPWAYFAQYPDDIDLVGASIATQVWGAAVTGEVSYRPNDPVPTAALVGPLVPTSPIVTDNPVLTRLDGFEREQRLQFVANVLSSIARGTRLVGPIVEWIGADEMTFLAEWGLVYYPGLDRSCQPAGDFDPNKPPVSTIQTACTPYAGPAGTSDQVDDVSWGYQLRIGPNYYTPLGLPVRLQPFVSWQHDVDGTTPGFNPYLDERMAVDVGFEVVYLDAWTTHISYASFFGGGNANQINDRDFLSMSISYAF